MQYKYDKQGKRYWEDGDRIYGNKIEGDKVGGQVVEGDMFKNYAVRSTEHTKPNDCRLYLTQIADGFSCSLCHKEYVLVS